MVKIQYASDLHLDEWPPGTRYESFLTPVAPILVLAGDICSAWDPRYTHFLGWCSRYWFTTIVVAGNHEYRSPDGGRDIEETDAVIAYQCAQFPNVVYLQAGASYVIPGTRLRFLGATLWSAIDPALWEEAARRKGDCLKIGRVPTHPSLLCARHISHVRALVANQQLWDPQEVLVVVTHHMPSFALLEPEYRDDAWRSFYASACDAFIGPQISAWICGHSHRAVHWRAPSGADVYMNARGSTTDSVRAVDVYNPAAVIDIPCLRLGA